eukprot:PhF_6_TR42348/c0_g1_i2/m.63889
MKKLILVKRATTTDIPTTTEHDDHNNNNPSGSNVHDESIIPSLSPHRPLLRLKFVRAVKDDGANVVAAPPPRKPFLILKRPKEGEDHQQQPSSSSLVDKEDDDDHSHRHKKVKRSSGKEKDHSRKAPPPRAPSPPPPPPPPSPPPPRYTRRDIKRKAYKDLINRLPPRPPTIPKLLPPLETLVSNLRFATASKDTLSVCSILWMLLSTKIQLSDFRKYPSLGEDVVTWSTAVYGPTLDMVRSVQNLAKVLIRRWKDIARAIAWRSVGGGN